MIFFLSQQIDPPNLQGMPAGAAGEEWISYLYRKKGFEIIGRNYEIFAGKKMGELDIVCVKGREIHFVEVKTRQNERFMAVEETVHDKKRQALRRMVKTYLSNHREYYEHNIQIDVAAVLLDPFDNTVKSVRILENAIEDTD